VAKIAKLLHRPRGAPAPDCCSWLVCWQDCLLLHIFCCFYSSE